MQTALVIPARNAAHSLPEVLEAALEVIAREEILVVDDASTDDTADCVRRMNISVLRTTKASGQGKGAALRCAFRHCLAEGVERIVTLDADGQHDARLLPQLLEHFDREGLDLLLGDRGFHDDPSSMPWDRRFSNRVTTALLNWRTGLSLRDSQCGYRVIRAWLLEEDAFRCTGFDFESELLLYASERGARIGEAPVPLVYNETGSHMHRLRDTLAFVRLYCRSLRKGSWHGSGA